MVSNGWICLKWSKSAIYRGRKDLNRVIHQVSHRVSDYMYILWSSYMAWQFCQICSCPSRIRQTLELPNQSQQNVVADLVSTRSSTFSDPLIMSRRPCRCGRRTSARACSAASGPDCWKGRVAAGGTRVATPATAATDDDVADVAETR